MADLTSEPIVMLIAAPRKSGKSYFNNLLVKHVFLDHYDKIHILSKSAYVNDDYKEFADNPKVELLDEFDDATIADIFNKNFNLKKQEKKLEDLHKELKRKVIHGDDQEVTVPLPEPDRNQVKYIVTMKQVQKRRRRKRKRTLANDVLDNFIPPNMRLHKELIAEASGKCNRKRKKRKIRVEQSEHDSVKCPNVLIIADDCVDTGVLRSGGAAEDIAFRGRHANVSAIFIAQRFVSFSTRLRENADLFVIFKQNTIRDFESYVEQFVPRHLAKEARMRIHAILDEEYRFVYRDNIARMWKTSTAHDFIKGKYEELAFLRPTAVNPAFVTHDEYNAASNVDEMDESDST